MKKIIVTVALLMLAQTASAACTDISLDLGLGSTDLNSNGNVTKLQNYLKDSGHLTAVPNGVFGPATVAAVKKFQTAQNLSSTGFVGPLTRGSVKTKSCVVPTPSVTTPSPSNGNTSITRPKAGASVTIGKKQIVRWSQEIKSTYSIILENQEGVSQGYIAVSRLGGTEFEWNAGDVFNTDSQRDMTVTPGTYKIRIRNTYSGTSANDPQSAVFTLVADPIAPRLVYPTTVPVNQDTTVVMYGSGFNDNTSMYLDGLFNVRTSKVYMSPDRKVFIISIPKTVPAGKHTLWAYNGYESTDTGTVITVE
ncbi:MAG: putative peptidoglycan binding domain [Candidatus Parcubacteria bacterium]|jgi:peptidoglycan hydrolase-like protein with peptidoglycan-binding domain